MIRIIFGNPGCGKTSLFSALACADMTGKAREYLLPCRKEIEALNRGGYDLTVPDKHAVFANINITSEAVTVLPRRSWYVNPAKIALPNKLFPAAFLPPYAQIYISEAQKYYNSREYKKLADAVSRWYETHRHNGHNVTLDCQRSTLIDLNIRGITEEFIEPLELRHRYGNRGGLIGSEWRCVVLNSCYDVDRYLQSGELPKNSERRTYTYVGNIFKTYDSRFAKLYHLRGRRYQDFELTRFPHVPPDADAIEAFNERFGYEFDEGQTKGGTH
jgi:hypothetical protein